MVVDQVVRASAVFMGADYSAAGAWEARARRALGGKGRKGAAPWIPERSSSVAIGRHSPASVWLKG